MPLPHLNVRYCKDYLHTKGKAITMSIATHSPQKGSPYTNENETKNVFQVNFNSCSILKTSCCRSTFSVRHNVDFYKGMRACTIDGH